MSQGKRIVLAVAVVVILVGISFVQGPIDYMRYNRESKSGLHPENIFATGDRRETSLLFDQSLQFFGGAAVGMREAVASMLWVRADEFFHSGQYEAILPLVRLVTWLDPQQIDVYSTGAWHLDYNFVDQEQRSDRRYIPPAIALLEEGIRNNPGIFDLYFELAWTHYYQKIRNYEQAVRWMEESCKKPARDPNTGKVIPRPAFVDRMLAHAYEKSGDLDKAEKQWLKILAESEKARKTDPDQASATQEVDVAKKNLGMLLLRRAWRNGDMGAYDRGIKILSSLKSTNQVEINALNGAKRNYAELKNKDAAPHDTQPPVDANFSATWRKVGPKVINIKGTMALVPAEVYKGLASESYTHWYEENLKKPDKLLQRWQDGGRVRIMLCDNDYDYRKLLVPDRFDWEVDKSQTIMVDEVSCRDGAFDIKIDMSQDPDKYPFVRDKYRLILWFNPQQAPDFIQDRIGWRGEGLTDKNYLDTKTNPGYRMLRKEFILEKSDII